MRFRKLRIAWSVFWGVACVLVIVLWVRSYWTVDLLELGSRPSTLLFQVGSAHGVVGCGGNANPLSLLWTADWIATSEPYDGHDHLTTHYGFLYEYDPSFGTVLFVPHWFVILLFATIAVVPWISLQKRFSLRTLLIATTLVAVVLGVAVWAAGK